MNNFGTATLHIIVPNLDCKDPYWHSFAGSSLEYLSFLPYMDPKDLYNFARPPDGPKR